MLGDKDIKGDNMKTIIGVGQTGSRLANIYAKLNPEDVLITFNTDERDSGGVKSKGDHVIVQGGAGQNYSRGLKIWAENKEKIERILEPVYDQDIVYFVGGGGGSGSSSVVTFLNILMKKQNRILVVPIIPFIKESLPATSNATRMLNRLSEFSNNMSVFVATNDEYKKNYGPSYEVINNNIVADVDILTNLVDYHDPKYLTPFAVDDNDHRSVAFSGGFINFSFDPLFDPHGGKTFIPKFSYGKIKDATNILLVRNVTKDIRDDETMMRGDDLVQSAMKIASSAKGSRIIYGILRVDKKLKMPEYMTIATGLDISKVFDKLREKATGSATIYNEKIHTKEKRKLERSEDKLLDV